MSSSDDARQALAESWDAAHTPTAYMAIGRAVVHALLDIAEAIREAGRG